MIRYWPFGPHTSIGNRLDGIGDQWHRLNAAGVPATIKCVDGYGPIYSLMQIGDAYDVENVCVFRLGSVGGHDWGVPNWHAESPEIAAQEHVEWTLRYLPPEFDKRVWLELINEPDKDEDVSLGWTAAEYADWLGRFAQEAGKLLVGQGYKFLAYGYSSGEPELEDWTTKGQIDYLALCARYPNQMGIALHEYSFNASDVPNDSWLIGRFERLFETCDQHGIARPNVYISEFGWTLWEIPSPDVAIPQMIALANELYALHPQVLGVGIWHFGTWSNDIKLKAHALLEPMTEVALNYRLEVDAPEPPPEAPHLIKNWSFENGWWDLSERQQTPNDWDLDLFEEGDVRGMEITVTPECVHKGADQLPPDEQLGGENALILDGNYVYKMFAKGTWKAALEQTINAPPGSTLIVAFPWNIHFDGRGVIYDPEDTVINFILGNQNMRWVMTQDRDRKWFYNELSAIVPDDGKIKLRLEISVKHAHDTAIFLDAILSEAIMPEDDRTKEEIWWDLTIQEQINHGLQLAPTAIQNAIRQDGFHPVTKEIYSPGNPPMMAAEDWESGSGARRVYVWENEQVRWFSDPSQEIPPDPPSDKIDLAPYFVPESTYGPIYELRRPDGSQERVQHQTADGFVFITKGTGGVDGKAEWEELRVDAQYIWRGIDTSPGENRFYRQSETGQSMAKWVARLMAPGQTFYGPGHYVQFYFKDTCDESAANSGNAQNVIKFVARHASKEWNGIVVNDVIELSQPGGERWFFARGMGMVAWESAWGSSAVSEIHEPGARPNNEREALPCAFA